MTAAQPYKTPEQYLREPYARVLILNPEGGYTATIREFPGCIAEGEGVVEAYKNLYAAALDWIAAAQDLGQPIPPPAVYEVGATVLM